MESQCNNMHEERIKTEGTVHGLIWSASLAFASRDVDEDSQSLSEV